MTIRSRVIIIWLPVRAFVERVLSKLFPPPKLMTDQLRDVAARKVKR